jgi:ribosomal protein S18 acetylase RimI-like enzyme
MGTAREAYSCLLARSVRLVHDDPVLKLAEPSLDEILDFCAEDPVERVFLEDVARRGLGRFQAVAENGHLTALCHIGTNVVPSGADCAAFARAAARSGARMIIGEEGAVGELWQAAREWMPRPRVDRPGQPVYVLEATPEPGDTRLRAATLRDLDLLVPASASAHQEELGADPLRRDPDGFRWRTRAQIEEGRSWVWLEGRTILFKAEASAWTPSAVQLQQVWVDPSARGRGYAQRGMRDLCRLLLEQVPSICLFVRPENAVAIHVYESIGMRHTISYRSLLF